MSKQKYDFSGYATKANIKCTDGRIILPGAFDESHGKVVPLVWQHLHNEPSNVLGHALLENRDGDVYLYGYFNESEDAARAKHLVEHRDISSLSIYANNLVEKSKTVMHGVIREVSLVLSGANPGAKIDNISIQHADGEEVELEDEAIIYTNEKLELFKEIKHEDNTEEDKEEGETIADVIATYSDKQKEALYAIIGSLVEKDAEEVESEEVAQSATNNKLIDEGVNEKPMKKNVFDNLETPINKGAPKTLSHDEIGNIFKNAQRLGSLKAAFMDSEEGRDFLAHAGGVTYGLTNIDYLYPDAKTVTPEPTFISRKMEWVAKVIGGAHHSPFSRIKSLHADITPDEARAKGYITGALKVEEVFEILRRVTTPTTVYKKQKLDRDDIIDITDFNVVAWLKREMRWMLDEELARAALLGDGRDPITQAADKINPLNIRPIYGDSSVYVHYQQAATAATDDDLIDQAILARINYRGSGSPTLFVSPTQLTNWLLLKDGMERRLYRNVSELASELRVSEIVEVPVMESIVRTVTATDYALKGIIVNMNDYTLGADKGGEVNFFDDFDIDYNQFKYLIEARTSGALTVPKGAIVLEQQLP